MRKLFFIGLVIILPQSCKKVTDNPTAVNDKDGNVYKTVTIGSQVWMTENLKTTKYNNGDLIGTTTPYNKDISSEEVGNKYQWPCNGNDNLVETYGRLYSLWAITDSRKLCPDGWHIPTKAEWTVLIESLGGNSTAGFKLKEYGIDHWSLPNIWTTNETGFTALPAGLHSVDGLFRGLGTMAVFWSSTMNENYPSGFEYYKIMMNNQDGNITDQVQARLSAFSVRCIMD